MIATIPDGLLGTASTALKALREAGDAPPARLVDDVFDAVYAVGLAYGEDAAAIDSVGRFVAATTPDVGALAVEWVSYPGAVERRFQRIWELDEWVQLCRARSGLQFFLDLYRNTGLADLVERVEAECPELDDFIRDRGDREGHLDPAQIDPGIPTTHWWWWEPPRSGS